MQLCSAGVLAAHEGYLTARLQGMHRSCMHEYPTGASCQNTFVLRGEGRGCVQAFWAYCKGVCCHSTGMHDTLVYMPGDICALAVLLAGPTPVNVPQHRLDKFNKLLEARVVSPIRKRDAWSMLMCVVTGIVNIRHQLNAQPSMLC